MSIEARHAGIIQEAEALRGTAKKPNILTRTANNLFVEHVLPRAEIIMSATKINFAEGFHRTFRENMQKGKFIVFAVTHDSLENGLSFSLVANDTMEVANKYLPEEYKIKGVLAPMASSLASGDQGSFTATMYKGMKDVMAKNHLYLTLLTRVKDLKLGLKENKDQYLEALGEGVRDYGAIGVFAEGTLDAGRKVKHRGIGKIIHMFDNQVNGMRRLKPNSMEKIIEIIEENGREAIIIPVAIRHGDAILEHSGRIPRPTFRAIGAAFNLSNPALNEVFVGMPFDPKEAKEAGINLTEQTGIKMAEAQTPERRGYYTDKIAA